MSLSSYALLSNFSIAITTTVTAPLSNLWTESVGLLVSPDTHKCTRKKSVKPNLWNTLFTWNLICEIHCVCETWSVKYIVYKKPDLWNTLWTWNLICEIHCVCETWSVKYIVHVKPDLWNTLCAWNLICEIYCECETWPVQYIVYVKPGLWNALCTWNLTCEIHCVHETWSWDEPHRVTCDQATKLLSYQSLCMAWHGSILLQQKSSSIPESKNREVNLYERCETPVHRLFGELHGNILFHTWLGFVCAWIVVDSNTHLF